MERRYRHLDTPTGPMALIREPSGDIGLEWLDEPGTVIDGREDPDLEPTIIDALTRYFAGEPVDFSFVPTPAGPPFYRSCWTALRDVPAGETVSYAELAVRAGSPKAIRAAGQAMRKNPLPVIVPCHRVIASDGTLHGFGGWRDPDSAALGRKARLLALEGRVELSSIG